MDNAQGLSAEVMEKIFHGNVSKVYPRFKEAAAKAGRAA
jgi:hypothetical protein